MGEGRVGCAWREGVKRQAMEMDTTQEDVALKWAW